MRVRRYVQTHTLDDPLNEAIREKRGFQVPYDGVAELWYDRKDLLASRNTPEGLRAGERAAEDKAKFVDFSRSAMWLAKEYVFIDRSRIIL